MICRIKTVSVALLILVGGCSRSPHRPSTVPERAVWIDGAFVECWIEEASHANRCTIYDEKSGEILLAGLFVLTGSGREAEQGDLRYQAFDGTKILLQDARSLEPVLLTEWSVPSSFESRLVMFAGALAVNCGRVKPGRDPSTSSDCALAAFQHRKPFYVSYDYGWRGASTGFAGDSEGNIHFVEYHLKKFPELVRRVVELADDDHIIFGACPKPVTLTRTESGQLTCAKPIARTKGTGLSNEVRDVPD
jgi:hypothetical protein